jgi:hypothetical protein
MVVALTVLICKWTKQNPSNQSHKLIRMDSLKGNMGGTRANATRKIFIIL